MILFICNSRPPFGKMHRPGAFITKTTVFMYLNYRDYTAYVAKLSEYVTMSLFSTDEAFIDFICAHKLEVTQHTYLPNR